MVASTLSERDSRVNEENTIEFEGSVRLLKTAAIYGANASGKSNFVAALRFFRHLIINSSKSTQAGEPTGAEPFGLNPRSTKQPCHFEMVFSLAGVVYRYGLEVNQESITAEWLFHSPKGKEARLFTRQGNDIDVGRGFPEGKPLASHTRANALFLSVAAQFNGELSSRLLGAFRSLNIISGLDDSGYLQYTLRSCEKDQNRDSVLRLLRQFDTGIENISVERRSLLEAFPKALPPAWKDFFEAQISGQERHALATIHSVFDDAGAKVGESAFDFETAESEGTKKLVALSGPVLETLTGPADRILVVDELDARFHPHLTRAILRLFRSPTTNPSGAQLIFTTHDVKLLNTSFFRRDQFWFAKKDRFGATQLISLAEYQGVRNDASLEKEYDAGRFGGIPFIREEEELAKAGV